MLIALIVVSLLAAAAVIFAVRAAEQAVTQELRAATAEASYESCKRRIAEQEAVIRRLENDVRDTHRLYVGHLRQKDIDRQTEVHALLERIQRPEFEPVPVAAVEGGPRKMHWSEDDEIAGVTQGQVAQAAGLSAEHERVIAHIDEIATAEGVPAE